MKTATSLIALICISLFATGCIRQRPNAYDVPDKVSFLGIIEHEKATFSETGPNSFTVRTDELVARDNYSGDRVSLFWGLITFED